MRMGVISGWGSTPDFGGPALSGQTGATSGAFGKTYGGMYLRGETWRERKAKYSRAAWAARSARARAEVARRKVERKSVWGAMIQVAALAGWSYLGGFFFGGMPGWVGSLLGRGVVGYVGTRTISATALGALPRSWGKERMESVAQAVGLVLGGYSAWAGYGHGIVTTIGKDWVAPARSAWSTFNRTTFFRF